MSYIHAIRAATPRSLQDAIGLPLEEEKGAQAIPLSSVELLLQLVAGAPCPPELESSALQQAWKEGHERFHAHVGGSTSLGKRARPAAGEDDQDGADADGVDGKQPGSSKKRSKISEDAVVGRGAEARGEPRFTLHALSVSAPIRKKVDVTITSSALLLSTPSPSSSSSSTSPAEAELAHPPIPLSSLKRAFAVTNLGKNRNKPHWTVIFTAADVVDKRDASTQLQLIFTLDHAPSAKDLFSTTDHTKTPTPARTSHPKGTETFPLLSAFLSFLPAALPPVVTSETSHQQIFKSASGQPYLDTYRAAKEGSLYFLAEGVLWAESKPVEFFALEDIAPDSEDPSLGGLRTLSATGRSFSLYLRRWIRGDKKEDEDEGILVDETEFSMIDGREQDNVMQWARRFKRKFGQRGEEDEDVKTAASSAKPNNGSSVDNGKAKAMTIGELDDDTDDDEDEDFVASSSDDESSDSSSEEEENGAEDGVENDDDDSCEEDGEGDVEMEDDMKMERHPLMRPGAMPRMSKAAMDMAVAMVTQDFVGGDEDDEEGDELDD